MPLPAASGEETKRSVPLLAVPPPISLGGHVARQLSTVPASQGDRGDDEHQRYEGALRRAIGTLETNLPAVSRAFSMPLLVLLLLLLYLTVQSRIDGGLLPSAAQDPATGGDDDDVEYLL
ncbi:MAG: hypothetical protein R3320_02665 [Nitriliruptorales bacterium]|nr:hypothetical protein [Nitriliruptorales bacterium]